MKKKRSPVAVIIILLLAVAVAAFFYLTRLDGTWRLDSVQGSFLSNDFGVDFSTVNSLGASVEFTFKGGVGSVAVVTALGSPASQFSYSASFGKLILNGKEMQYQCFGSGLTITEGDSKLSLTRLE